MKQKQNVLATLAILSISLTGCSITPSKSLLDLTEGPHCRTLDYLVSINTDTSDSNEVTICLELDKYCIDECESMNIYWPHASNYTKETIRLNDTKKITGTDQNGKIKKLLYITSPNGEFSISKNKEAFVLIQFLNKDEYIISQHRQKISQIEYSQNCATTPLRSGKQAKDFTWIRCPHKTPRQPNQSLE